MCAVSVALRASARIADARRASRSAIVPIAASTSLVSAPAGAARSVSAAYPIPSDSLPFASLRKRTTAASSGVLAGSRRCTRTMVGRM